MLAAAHGPSALWYATRGSGAVTLILLTASVVMGIVEVGGWQPARVTRYAVASMHRTVSLVAVALLVIHIITTVLDPFPPIGALNAILPFATTYRPLWLGLGTLAGDVLLAIALTSLARRRLGYRAWRGTHWLAYGCWPVALLHGIGAGSDTKETWMLALTLACVGAVVIALGIRLTLPDVTASARPPAILGAALGVLGLAVWLPQGPLARGWPARAGTPTGVLTAFAGPRRRVRVARPAVTPDPLARPFSAALAGPIRNGVDANGTAVVDIRMDLSGGPAGVLRVRLGGVAVPGGGVQMNRSAVTLGPPTSPNEFRGRIQSLRGSDLEALVGAADGRAVRLTVNLSLGPTTVTGQVQGTPVGGGGV
jgi:hypothetical protein